MGDYVLLKNETLVATNANGEVMLGDIPVNPGDTLEIKWTDTIE